MFGKTALAAAFRQRSVAAAFFQSRGVLVHGDVRARAPAGLVATSTIFVISWIVLGHF